MELLIGSRPRRKAIAGLVSRYCEAELAAHRRPFPVCRRGVSEFLVAFVGERGGSSKSVGHIVSSLVVYSHYNNLPWLNASAQHRVKDLIKELQFHDPFPVKQVLPIMVALVEEMADTMDLTQPSELLAAMSMALCHNSLMRSGELMSGIMVEDIEWDHAGRSLTVALFRTKTHRRYGTACIKVVDYPGRSAYKLVKRWFDMWGLWGVHKAFLIPRRDRGHRATASYDFAKPATIGWFKRVISFYLVKVGRDPTRYSGHSFRAGGATDLFAIGMPYPQIKKMGRWKSDAAMRYYRDEQEVADAAASAFGRRLMAALDVTTRKW